MTVAIYPGSFNPWHQGHEDILIKVTKLFDKVVVARGINPSKKNIAPFNLGGVGTGTASYRLKCESVSYSGLLKDFIAAGKYDAIIKSLRNPQDFTYEQAQQYWNEDLGIIIPVVYIIADRKLVHISSSAIRAVEASKNT